MKQYVCQYCVQCKERKTTLKLLLVERFKRLTYILSYRLDFEKTNKSHERKLL